VDVPPEDWHEGCVSEVRMTPAGVPAVQLRDVPSSPIGGRVVVEIITPGGKVVVVAFGSGVEVVLVEVEVVRVEVLVDVVVVVTVVTIS